MARVIASVAVGLARASGDVGTELHYCRVQLGGKRCLGIFDFRAQRWEVFVAVVALLLALRFVRVVVLIRCFSFNSQQHFFSYYRLEFKGLGWTDWCPV